MKKQKDAEAGVLTSLQNEYRIPKELAKYVRAVLIRSFYDCQMIHTDEEFIFVRTNAVSTAFQRILLRAKCEQCSERDGLFYVTEEEARNHLYMNCLKEFTKRSAFAVLKE